jgi:hypothetical protein
MSREKSQPLSRFDNKRHSRKVNTLIGLPHCVRMVGELDKGENGPFSGAVYELRVIHAGLPLGWRARCTILELESSNGQRTNRAEEL